MTNTVSRKPDQTSFEALGIDPDIIEALRDLGYESPTPIQASCISHLLKGRDLIGQSQTGTGKTAAFGLPLLMLTDPEDRRLQAVVLCPTRELSLQAAEELRKFLKYRPSIRVACVYGGQPISRQINDLKKGAQIIVGTPGRFLDHLARHTIRLSEVQMVVLDEADEMLSMGFLQEVDTILSQMPEVRQTALFSATMPDEITALASRYLTDPVVIHDSSGQPRTVSTVKQYYCQVRAGRKEEALLRVLSYEDPQHVLVFCNTKKRTADVAEFLKKNHLRADGLSGDLKQVQRDLVMKQFRDRSLTILTATDVAARGLDIEDVDLVVNFDLPSENELYVHRIGRTARAGRSGISYVFVTEKELPRLEELTAYTGCPIEPRRVPTFQQIADTRRRKFMGSVRVLLSQASANSGMTQEGSVSRYLEDIRMLEQEGHQAEDIACAIALHALYEPEKPDDELSRTPEHILSQKDRQHMTRLYIAAGRKHQIKVKDLTDLIFQECGLPAASLGQIDLMDTFTFLEVPEREAMNVLNALEGKQIRHRTLHVELAQEDKEHSLTKK